VVVEQVVVGAVGTVCAAEHVIAGGDGGAGVVGADFWLGWRDW
jgi:hypothetical protein